MRTPAPTDAHAHLGLRDKPHGGGAALQDLLAHDQGCLLPAVGADLVEDDFGEVVNARTSSQSTAILQRDGRERKWLFLIVNFWFTGSASRGEPRKDSNCECQRPSETSS